MSIIWCLIIAAGLCTAQVLGETYLILSCLICFMMLVVWAALKNRVMPVMLFFLPWATLLKTDPASMSFFTVALILVCLIAWAKRRFRLCFYVFSALALILITFFSKMIDSYSVDNSFILFVIMLLFFPLLKREAEFRYDFGHLTVSFALGIITAALSARQLVEFPAIARYIDVHTASGITRLSGYYGDPNFYSAHITAALSGILVILLDRRKSRQRPVYVLLALVLLYCGFLSASKAFALVAICLMILWVIQILFMGGKLSAKAMLVLGTVIAGAFVLSSSVFADLIDVIAERFSQAENISDLTTGRTEIWMSYFDAITSDLKVLFIGEGFTNVKVNRYASHSTLIQIIYQFGLLGIVPMTAWIIMFAKRPRRLRRLSVKHFLRVLILLTGIFGPWMSIDMLFFDEFFLMQFYMYAAVCLLRKGEEKPMKSNQIQ